MSPHLLDPFYDIVYYVPWFFFPVVYNTPDNPTTDYGNRKPVWEGDYGYEYSVMVLWMYVCGILI